MNDSKKTPQEQAPEKKPADRAQPNKNSRRVPVAVSLENYQPPEKK